MEKKLDFRIEKTYMSLHNAFATLIEEGHFEDFTVNDLCERAMIRRTTFYKHFADKFDYFSPDLFATPDKALYGTFNVSACFSG